MSEAAAELAGERDWGSGVAAAGVDGGLRETLVIGDPVELSDVLLGDHLGDTR